MLYPSINTIRTKADSRYTLVILAAKRARDIIEGMPKLTEEEAMARIGETLTAGGARLCVIPENDAEVLCYEISATDGSGSFLVYIDAMTGVERELMQVVTDGSGSFVM